MPLPVPSLDDTTFDDLVAEGHALIPRAFPGWTDHNESDPGVTLLELFAFLVESLIYRFDRIPDRTLVNLARLVGVEPRPGQPTDDLLAVAAGTLTRPTAAVTAADIAALVRGGLLAVDPPLATDLPAGTPVEWLDPRVPATVTPAGPTPGPPAAAVAGRAATGPTVAPAATTTTGPALAQAAGASPPAGAAVGRLATAVPAGATTIPVLAPAAGWPSPPAGWPEPPTGPIRLAGPDGPQDAVATAAVARAEAVAADPAGGADEPDGPGGSGLVRVVLVPAGAAGDGPVPAESLLQQAFELLRARTLLTTRVRAVGPVYRPVRIGVVVVRDPATLLRRDAVAAAVGSALAGYLSPGTGGAAGRGWEFGRPVFRSELYGLLEGVPGVDHVATLLLDGDASTQALPLHADPALAAQSLVRLDAADVTVLDPGSAAAP